MQSWQAVRTTLKLFAFLTVVVIVGGTVLYYYTLRNVIIRDGRRGGATRVLAAARQIDEVVAHTLRSVEAIAADPEIRRAAGGGRAHLGAAREHLLLYRRSFNFISCSLLDRKGNLIISTDPSGGEWRSGRPSPLPPWFESTLAGEPTATMALEQSSRKRSLIFSQPVYGDGTEAAGVAIARTTADSLSRLLLDAPEGIFLLTVEEGSIFLSSRPSLLGLRLWAAPQPAAGTRGVEPAGTPSRRWSGLARQSAAIARDSEGLSYDIHEKGLGGFPGATLTYLHDRKAFLDAGLYPVFGKYWFAFAGFCVAAILMVFVFCRAALHSIGIREARERLLAEWATDCGSLARAAEEAVFTVTAEGLVVYCNKAATVLFGLSQNQIEGRPVTRLISRHDLERCRAAMRTEPVENGSLPASGGTGFRGGKTPFPVEMSIANGETGGRRLSTIVVREVVSFAKNEQARQLPLFDRIEAD